MSSASLRVELTMYGYAVVHVVNGSFRNIACASEYGSYIASS